MPVRGSKEKVLLGLVGHLETSLVLAMCHVVSVSLRSRSSIQIKRSVLSFHAALVTSGPSCHGGRA